jgi:hypothetical protein
MIDVGTGYSDFPLVETRGYKMIDGVSDKQLETQIELRKLFKSQRGTPQYKACFLRFFD